MALMVHFKLDESSGTTATDSSGEGRNGTLANFTDETACWLGSSADGKRSGGLDMGQGTDDTCTFAFTDPGNLTTMMAFVRWDGTSTYPRIIHVGKGNTTPYQLLYIDHVRDALAFGATFGGGTQWFYTAANTLDYNGAWTHLAVTYDASASTNNPIFYINGVVSATNVETRTSGDRIELDEDSGAIGNVGAGGGNNRNLNGVLSDVRIYNHILTAYEIDIIANFHPYEAVDGLNLKADFTIDRYKELSKQYATRGGMDNKGTLQAPFSIGARGGANIRNRSKVYKVEK